MHIMESYGGEKGHPILTKEETELVEQRGKEKRLLTSAKKKKSPSGLGNAVTQSFSSCTM